MQEAKSERPSLLSVSCHELNGGWSGHLSVDSRSIIADLYRFSRETHHHTESENTSLVLETGQIATLLRCLSQLWGSHATSTRSVSHHRLSAEYMLLGIREWSDTDKVAAFEFCLPDAHMSFAYSEHHDIDLQEDGEFLVHIHKIAESKFEILRIDLDDYEVVISKNKSILSPKHSNTNSDPVWITINYKNPRSFSDCFQIPFQIKFFFELSEGRPLRKSELSIRAAENPEIAFHSRDETIADQLLDFALFQSESSTIYNETKQHGHRSIFRLFTPTDREITKKALSNWLTRRKEWEISYWLGSQLVHSGDSYDRGKLLRAMAWFESIPDYKIDIGLSEEALKRFRRDCHKMESFLNLGVPPDRLSQVLAELKRIPLSERFQKAVIDIVEVFGQDIIEPTIEADCRRAIKLRNNAAHGSYSADEDDFRESVIAATAVETVALLATIRALDLPPEHARLIGNWIAPHPLASHGAFSRSRER